MSRTPRRSIDGRLLPDPGRIAPSVDKAWRDDFIVELRLLGVPGSRIGDALMTVEAHVTESGEDAREAFGDATAYAQEVADSAGAVDAWKVSTRTVAAAVLGLVGMLITVRAFAGWLQASVVGVTVGDLVALALLLTVLLVTLAAATEVMRLLFRSRWWAIALPLAAIVGVFSGLMLLFQDPLIELSALPLGVAGVGLVAVSSVLFWLDQPEDLDVVAAPGADTRPGLGARILAALPVPILTVACLGLVWLLDWIVG